MGERMPEKKVVLGMLEELVWTLAHLDYRVAVIVGPRSDIVPNRGPRPTAMNSSTHAGQDEQTKEYVMNLSWLVG